MRVLAKQIVGDNVYFQVKWNWSIISGNPHRFWVGQHLIDIELFFLDWFEEVFCGI